MNSKNMAVLTNIIGAVESGGQVYGKRNYAAYADPYKNSPKEYTITLGWAQNYGDEAYRLISMIYADDPASFDKIDPTGKVKAMINGEHNWVKEKWKPSTYQKYVLIALIDSESGHKCQDKLFAELMNKYIADCEKTYTKDVKTVMMYCEIRHLGGKGAADRIFKKCGGTYTLDKIMSVLKLDQSDTSSNNQVGDKKFWSRHEKCGEWIEKYAVSESGASEEAKVADTSWIITDFSKYTGMISNSGSDERGKATGGTAGDQTGKEWCIKAWYNRPWSVVLRYPDEKVRNCIATLAIEAANNNKIGYDQSQRTTYWKQLKASGYRPSKINTACEADCSAGVSANIKATGYLLGLKALQNVSENNYTGSLKKALANAGFEILTDRKYLTGTTYLLPGDILLNEGHHTATNLGKGDKSAVQTTTTTKSSGGYMFTVETVKNGSKNKSVNLLQRLLKVAGYKGKDNKVLSIDGEAGTNTIYAVRAYQRAHKLTVDGIAGSATWKSLLGL